MVSYRSRLRTITFLLRLLTKLSRTIGFALTSRRKRQSSTTIANLLSPDATDINVNLLLLYPQHITNFLKLTSIAGKKVVRSGYFTLAHIEGVLGLAGFHGYNWSSHSSSTNTHTYALSINNTAIYSSGANNRYYGFPLRCLSTVLDM